MKLVGVIILSALSSTLWSQEIYRTTKGYFQATAVIEDTTVLAESNDLMVVLDYESAEIKMILDKRTVTTGNSNLDSLIHGSSQRELIFNGELDIEYINTKNHPPQDFKVSGYLECEPHNEYLEGKAHLEHIYSGYYSCVLALSFHLNLEELGLMPQLKGFEPDIHIEIAHTVLKRESER